MIKENTKMCLNCLKELPISNFYFRKDNNKYRSECKQCSLLNQKVYISNNLDKIKQLQHRNYLKNKDKIKEYNKHYILNNLDKIKQLQHQNYLKNKDKIKEYNKQYNLNNRKEINKNRRIKCKHNINFKLSCSLRSRIHDFIKGTDKSEFSEKLLMCSWDEARKYIESKWLPGMSWDNYGKFGWHMDHIIPCSFFDLTDLTEQYVCFRWQNLQPLWANDNLKKSSKIIKG